MIMIKLRNVHKSFGKQHVHNGINLDIKNGAVTVILGPSGTGKSVLLKEMIGLIRPDSGEIIVNDIDITKISQRQLLKTREMFGMLFQGAALFDSMTVYDNIAFPLRERTNYSESKIKKLVLEKLKMVGLKNAEYKYPSEISGGMQKRVGLARAIISEPTIMLYDEPTTGLDPIMSDVVSSLIINMQKQFNMTSVVISHDIESTMKIANYIGLIYKGKIIYYGTPDDIAKTDNPYIKQFFSGSENGPMNV